MAMEKKSLVSKKTAPATKSNSTKSKIDTSKPAASKVVAASPVATGSHHFQALDCRRPLEFGLQNSGGLAPQDRHVVALNG